MVFDLVPLHTANNLPGLSWSYFRWGLRGFIFHVFVGYVLVYFFTNWHPLWGAIGGAFPDIDSISYFIEMPHELLIHRGITHTLFFLMMLVGVMLVLDWEMKRIGPFVIGYMSHLVIDWTVPWGIMWFWPITDTYYEFEPITLHIANVESFILIGGLFLMYITPRRWYLNYDFSNRKYL